MSAGSTDASAKTGTRRSTTFPINESLINITDPEKLRLADWIRGKHTLETLSCEATLQRSAAKWREGTNAWLYNDETFSKWLASTRANVNENTIFLTAGPGCGKTVLASALAQRLRKQGKTAIITYYDFKNKDKRTAISALRSLAIDLLRAAEYVPDKVLREHKNAILSGDDTIDDHALYTIVQVIRHLVSAFPELYIFVDGLDECRQRQALGTLLQPLFRADVDGTVKWFITTRADHDVTAMLTRCGAREIKAAKDEITKDILSYLNATFRDLADSLGLSEYDDSLDELFSAQVSEGKLQVDSNFVWAAGLKDLLLSRLVGGISGLVTAILELPKGMRDLYIRSLERLKALDKQSRTPLARKMFCYIIAAEQPLRLSELSHALATSPGVKDFRADKVRSFDKIKALGVGLVSFGEVNGGTAEDPIVTFEHLTIYDFLTDVTHSKIPKDLQEYFVPLEGAQEELGLACLQYLSYRRYETLGPVKEVLAHPDHAFLKYAAAFWHHHLDIRSPTAGLQFTVETFVDSPNFWTCAAVQSVVAPYAWARYEPWKGEYAPILGNILPLPDLSVVHFGIPLPEFIKHEGAKHITQFAQQWHHVLNNCQDDLHQCRMHTAWEDERPDLRRWLTTRPHIRSITSAGNETGMEGIHTGLLSYKPARFCCVLRQTTGRTIYFRRDMLTGTSDQQPCIGCTAAAPDAELQVQSISQWAQTDQNEEDRAMDVIREHSHNTGITIDAEWSIASSTSNVTLLDDPSRTPALAVQWYKKPETSDDKSDMGLGGDDETTKSYDHMLFLARRGHNPVAHSWSSSYKGHMVGCAFFPSKPWILWSSDVGELCALRGADIERVKLDEPKELLQHVEHAVRIYRGIELSKDGTKMWYISFTTKIENLSFTHHLTVTAFQLSSTDADISLVRTGSQTVQYSTFGWLRFPSIKVSLNDRFGLIALPPLGSRPRILRFSLTTSGIVLETLQQPILFPATAPSRNPSIDYLIRDGESDVLVLSLSAETTTAPAAMGEEASEHANCHCHLLESKPLLQGPTTIAWHIDRVTDWRIWDQEKDGSSEEFAVSTKMRNVRGDYLDQDKPFRVSIRSGINWTKQSTLTCRT